MPLVTHSSALYLLPIFGAQVPRSRGVRALNSPSGEGPDLWPNINIWKVLVGKPGLRRNHLADSERFS
jgi:hypothetical protein